MSLEKRLLSCANMSDAQHCGHIKNDRFMRSRPINFIHVLPPKLPGSLHLCRTKQNSGPFFTSGKGNSQSLHGAQDSAPPVDVRGGDLVFIVMGTDEMCI